jgi:hypothetical protein
MTTLPQLSSARRPARLRPPDVTPAVLRLQDGGCTTGELQVVSLTGGLLGLSPPLHQGSLVKLMFLTSKGPVMGAAEMLTPVTRSQQPFRFVTLHEEAQRRLQTAIQSSLYRQGPQEAWIEKYRAAVNQIEPPQRRLSRVLLGSLGLGLLGLAGTLYALHAHLLK